MRGVEVRELRESEKRRKKELLRSRVKRANVFWGIWGREYN